MASARSRAFQRGLPGNHYITSAAWYSWAKLIRFIIMCSYFSALKSSRKWDLFDCFLYCNPGDKWVQFECNSRKKSCKWHCEMSSLWCRIKQMLCSSSRPCLDGAEFPLCVQLLLLEAVDGCRMKYPFTVCSFDSCFRAATCILVWPGWFLELKFRYWGTGVI